tara:strand:+ start:165 stop:620 length:456 start_codon:yes stop_codon:yes gene_type:complete
MDDESYEGWYIEKPIENKSVKFKKEYGDLLKDSQKLYLTDWKNPSLYFTYFKFIGIIGLTILAISQFQSILNSVRTRKTFKKANVSSFRRIGIYCIALSILLGVSDWDFGNYHTSTLSIDFTVLIIALLAFIFAEIFKEGNQLMEENKLTV